MHVSSLLPLPGIRIRHRNPVSPQLSSREAQHPSSYAVRQRNASTAGSRRSSENGSIAGESLHDFPEKATATLGRCPRPRRIILVRHGESQGNVDESFYTRIPDPKIELTEKGWRDAEETGRRIREMIVKDDCDDWKVYFYVSPYTRTLQTLRGLGRAFERERITGVREEPRLREQDFGNFQDREKMRIDKAKRLKYGRFFYRFPDGESAADVYDRITGFRETLRADIDIGRFQPPSEWTPNMNLIIISHGLALRVFLMRWYKWTVQQFECLHNFGNGGMIVMQTGTGGRYSLLVHHTVEELRKFGLTEEMLYDQRWQLKAKPDLFNFSERQIAGTLRQRRLKAREAPNCNFWSAFPAFIISSAQEIIHIILHFSDLVVELKLHNDQAAQMEEQLYGRPSICSTEAVDIIITSWQSIFWNSSFR